MKQKRISTQKRISKQKHISLCFGISLFIVLTGVSSCSSLPSGIGETVPAEDDGFFAEMFADAEGRPDETPFLGEAAEVSAEEGGQEADNEEAVDETTETTETAEAVIENDTADIQKRAEEDLAYLDTPVNPDLPEPVYVFPEDETVLADAEPVPEPGETDGAELADAAESSFDAEPVEQAGSPAEMADGSASSEIVEGGDSGPAEVIVQEPPPPVSLLPPREVSAVSPPRSQGSLTPVSLPQQPARVPPRETEKVPPVERTIQAALGETVEVPLPGSGWVYLGEAGEQKGLPYRRRRVSADGQVFVFMPEAAGSYRLTFKQQDLLRGTDTDAVIEVAVAEKAVSAIPAGVASVEMAALKEEAAFVPPSDAGAVSEGSERPSEPLTAAVITAAITDDAALWHRGQELEAPGANRDMKGALTAYKTLVKDYPQSEYYAGSRKRIAYIERFFVNIH